MRHKPFTVVSLVSRIDGVPVPDAECPWTGLSRSMRSHATRLRWTADSWRGAREPCEQVEEWLLGTEDRALADAVEISSGWNDRALGTRGRLWHAIR